MTRLLLISVIAFTSTITPSFAQSGLRGDGRLSGVNICESDTNNYAQQAQQGCKRRLRQIDVQGCQREVERQRQARVARCYGRSTTW